MLCHSGLRHGELWKHGQALQMCCFGSALHLFCFFGVIGLSGAVVRSVRSAWVVGPGRSWGAQVRGEGAGARGGRRVL